MDSVILKFLSNLNDSVTLCCTRLDPDLSYTAGFSVHLTAHPALCLIEKLTASTAISTERTCSFQRIMYMCTWKHNRELLWSNVFSLLCYCWFSLKTLTFQVKNCVSSVFYVLICYIFSSPEKRRCTTWSSVPPGAVKNAI